MCLWLLWGLTITQNSIYAQYQIWIGLVWPISRSKGYWYWIWDRRTPGISSEPCTDLQTFWWFLIKPSPVIQTHCWHSPFHDLLPEQSVTDTHTCLKPNHMFISLCFSDISHHSRASHTYPSPQTAVETFRVKHSVISVLLYEVFTGTLHLRHLWALSHYRAIEADPSVFDAEFSSCKRKRFAASMKMIRSYVQR